MLGVPSFWREGNRDALNDPMLHEIIKMSDIVSPWSVGRYRSPTEAEGHARRVWRADLDWCQKHRIDFLPVVFPGFSWRNLHGGPLNEIPRQKGEFLWSQITAAKSSGAKMIYVAMFDEADEATAIFKCTNPPTSMIAVTLWTTRACQAISIFKWSNKLDVSFETSPMYALLPTCRNHRKWNTNFH